MRVAECSWWSMSRLLVTGFGRHEIDRCAQPALEIGERDPALRDSHHAGKPDIAEQRTDRRVLGREILASERLGEQVGQVQSNTLDLLGGRCVGQCIGARGRVGKQPSAVQRGAVLSYEMLKPFARVRDGDRCDSVDGIEFLEASAEHGQYEAWLGGKVTIDGRCGYAGDLGHVAHVQPVVSVGCRRLRRGGDDP